MPDFPLDQLTVRDGVLTLAAPSLPAVPYLDNPPLRVVGKDTLVELPRGDVSYMFMLSHVADAAWTELFNAFLDGLAAEIHGAQLELRCNPADLERAYAQAKDLVARTNRAYAEQKSRLVDRVTELEAERTAALRAGDEHSRALREQFERLAL